MIPGLWQHSGFYSVYPWWQAVNLQVLSGYHHNHERPDKLKVQVTQEHIESKQEDDMYDDDEVLLKWRKEEKTGYWIGLIPHIFGREHGYYFYLHKIYE